MADNSEKDTLERIKKLLALGQSTNPNEAAVALLRAQKLMREHNISEHDLELSSVAEDSVQVQRGLTNTRLIRILSSVIRKAFGVEAMLTVRGSTCKKVTFFGPPDRLDLAIYSFTFLSRQMLIAKKTFAEEKRSELEDDYLYDFLEQSTDFTGYITDLDEYFYELDKIKKAISSELAKLTRAYMEGWICSVKNKVAEFAMSVQEKNLLLEYKDSRYTVHTTRPRASYLTQAQSQAFSQGKIDGRDSFELYNGIGGQEMPKLKNY